MFTTTKQNLMIVIGLIGPIGCGKGTVADYLKEKHGFESIAMGDVVREEVRDRGLEITRDNTIMVSKEQTNEHGPDYWLNKTYEKARDLGTDKLIIDGLRYPHDVDFMKEKFPELKVILITAKPETRFERMITRGRPGFSKTIDEFRKTEERENETFHFDQTFQKANYTIHNDGTLEELHENTEKAIHEAGLA